MHNDLQREVGLTLDYIKTVRKTTNKSLNALAETQQVMLVP